jgi:hypothetical protein
MWGEMPGGARLLKDLGPLAEIGSLPKAGRVQRHAAGYQHAALKQRLCAFDRNRLKLTWAKTE